MRVHRVAPETGEIVNKPVKRLCFSNISPIAILVLSIWSLVAYPDTGRGD